MKVRHRYSERVERKRETDRQTDTQIDRQTDRQTDTQTHIHTHTHTQRERGAQLLALLHSGGRAQLHALLGEPGIQVEQLADDADQAMTVGVCAVGDGKAGQELSIGVLVTA